MTEARLNPKLLAIHDYNTIMALANTNDKYAECCSTHAFWKTKIDRYEPEDRQALYLKSVENGALNHVTILLVDEHVDPQCEGNYAIKYACKKNMNDMAHILLQSGMVDPTVDNNYCISVAVVNNNTELVKALLPYPGVDPMVHDSSLTPLMAQEEIRSGNTNVSTSLFLIACVDYNNIEMMAVLMDSGKINPAINDNYALTHAVTTGNHRMVALLLSDERVDVSMDDQYLLRYTVDHLDDQMLQLLLNHPRSDVTVYDGYMLMKAVRDEKHTTLALLCDRLINQSDDHSVESVVTGILQHAFITACAMGDIKSVSTLIPHVDPSFEKSQSLKLAQRGGHDSVVQLLMRDGRSVIH